MADKKISQLTAATTPLAGTETLPIVQGGQTVKASAQSIANLAPAELPSQTGNNGKYLTTNGSTASWATVSAGTPTLILKITTDGMGGATYTTIQGVTGITPTVIISGGIIFIGNTFTATSTVYAIPQMNAAQTAIWFPVQTTSAPAGFVGLGVYQENGTQIFMNSNTFATPLIVYIFP